MNDIKIPSQNPKTTPAPAAAAPAVQPEGVIADLDVLIQRGVVERTVSPFNGVTFKDYRVTLHTLENHERIAVSREIPNEEVMSLAVAEHAPKIPTLVYAISCMEMGEKKYMFNTAESKTALRVLLSKMSAVMIDILYLEYLKMTNDLITIIETGVKKN